jgi:hypothetical protein
MTLIGTLWEKESSESMLQHVIISNLKIDLQTEARGRDEVGFLPYPAIIQPQFE